MSRRAPDMSSPVHAALAAAVLEDQKTLKGRCFAATTAWGRTAVRVESPRATSLDSDPSLDQEWLRLESTLLKMGRKPNTYVLRRLSQLRRRARKNMHITTSACVLDGRKSRRSHGQLWHPTGSTPQSQAHRKVELTHKEHW